MINILIVGLGNLGSRYLEGLSALQDSFIIDILEPDNSAYSRGLSLAHKTDPISVIKRVSIESLANSYKLIIVATTSSSRSTLLKMLSSRTQAEHWIIEKVLAQSSMQVEQIIAELPNSFSWVNTPRRLTQLYRFLKRTISVCTHLEFEIVDPMFSLGCNSIHFLDTFEWLTGEEIIDISIDARSDWYSAKRLGYSEFKGILCVKTVSGSKMTINNLLGYENMMAIKANKKKYLIDENSGIFLGTENIYKGRLEYQSELMSCIMQSIKESDFKDFLPDLHTSARQHITMFNGLSASKLKPSIDDIWPIT